MIDVLWILTRKLRKSTTEGRSILLNPAESQQFERFVANGRHTRDVATPHRTANAAEYFRSTEVRKDSRKREKWSMGLTALAAPFVGADFVDG